MHKIGRIKIFIEDEELSNEVHSHVTYDVMGRSDYGPCYRPGSLELMLLDKCGTFQDFEKICNEVFDNPDRHDMAYCWNIYMGAVERACRDLVKK